VKRTRDLGDAVEIRVRDNGAGIAPEIKDKLFQPFFTTKPTGEGTGLGLSISWDIVTQQHGGTIEVDSVVGEFTEFAIRLPRTAGGNTRDDGVTASARLLPPERPARAGRPGVAMTTTVMSLRGAERRSNLGDDGMSAGTSAAA
jgi:Histidine kinase-, DNA gyrase B-, and HSP90-like ATPase